MSERVMEVTSGLAERLQPYGAYKPSGVPWLGMIPAHWEIGRSKRLFLVRKERARPDDVQLSATQAYGVIPQAEFEAREGRRVVKIHLHLEQRRHVERDDFVISMRSFQGGLERAWASGAIRSSYVVLKPGPQVDVGLFQYLLKSRDYVRALQSTASFIRDGQDLTVGNFYAVDLPVIPREEQRLMGRYVAALDSRVRRFVRGKQRLIKLLEEQKQAIIRQLVSRGVDGSVPLKSSGNPWLGEVPDHWELRKLRHCGRMLGGMTPSMEINSYWSGNIPWVTPKDMKTFMVDSAKMFVSSTALEQTGLRLLEPGAVLLVVRGMILARHVPVAVTAARVTVNQDMKAIQCVPGIDSRFLAFAIQARQCELASMVDEAGHGTRRLPTERFRDIVLQVPPHEEQVVVVREVEQMTMLLDEGVTRVRAQVGQVREYRDRLVADIVTGKLDVRIAAARLPDVSELLQEPEAADMSDDLDDEAEGLEAEEALA